jgi:inner membrane protein
MFIGHLPAGYILTKTVQKNVKTSKYLLVGLIASVLPDIDILYFYLIDNRQNLHHIYWSHIPFYWLLIGIITFSIIWLSKQKVYYITAIIFFANIFLHLLLDTVVAKIMWLYPATNKAFFLFDVPAVYNFWVYNFAFHWTFLFEIALVGGATYILVKDKLKLRKKIIY